jgi:ribosome biogenesis GTPase
MNKRETGRIVRSLSGFYDVELPEGTVTCRARGILRKEGMSPLTGDMVEITRERGKGMVEKVLPRRNHFIRPAVANVDALVVFAANVNPITEPFLIDRVAAIAGDQEVPVYLCVNKCDLDPAEKLVRIYEKAGFPVICTSAETGEGVESLRQLIAGKLTAFTGNSGVGKSSILNAWPRS